ncbi:IS701 family transposase [Streptomyces sp. cg35]|uniref:IS701 family transposase n=1 Tax=Streptomyces sp. cg35 TaxID=3421650 RepID=UPI003D17C71E
MTVHNTVGIHSHGRVPARTDSDELLSEFIDRLFAHLPRADQRNRSREYVTGLLTTPGKKSLRRMAAAVSDSPYASQALQQFLNVSPWDWQPTRRALADWATRNRPTLTWSLGLAVLPKRGHHSAGVHRRYIRDVDRTVNCQLGVGLFLGSADHSLPVDWRLALPGSWQTDEPRRAAARIPDDQTTPAEGACALDLVRAQIAASGRQDIPVVVDLTEVPHDSSLLPGLATLGTGFVAQVPDRLAASLLSRQSGPVAASEFLRGGTASPGFAFGVVPGTGGRARSHVRTCAVRLADGVQRVPHRPCSLLVEQPVSGRGARYFVTDLGQQRPSEILRLADTTHRTQEAVRNMHHHYGLRDFEGRSYLGWHHHMTLVSAAYAFSRLTGHGPAAEAAPVLPQAA